MSQTNLQSVSRRDFLKLAGGAVATAAVASAVPGSLGGGSLLAPQRAFAATGDPVALSSMVVGTQYTVSANLYVPPHVHEQTLIFVKGKSAYLTNPSNPMMLQGFPTSPVSDNAVIVRNANNTYTVTIPVVNEMFSLLELGTAEGVTKGTIIKTDNYYYPSKDRICSVELTLSNTGTDPIFTGNEEYAAYPIVASLKYWDIYLNVDFNSVKEA